MSDLFRLSGLARSMRPSPIRELFPLIQQPGMISFAGGLPDPNAFPVDEFAACADVLQRDGRAVLQYGASEGYGPLREVLIEMMFERLGIEIDASQLLITSGSQQALDLAARALLDPGDVVVVEAPTYPGTLHCLRNAGARFACVPCDEDGMCVERLRGVVERCDRRPKLIYTVPDFANPSGTCMTHGRRQRLLELAGELEIPVFEDDPYGRLRYRGESLPTLRRIAQRSPLVVYASSFSKVLAPGVRVAWTVASPEIVRAMVLMRQGEDLCTSTVTQALVAEYCRRGLLEQHLERMIPHYAAKCVAMGRALGRHLPPGAAHWHEPEGGYFFWLRTPERDGQQLFHAAVEAGVAFLPGAAFYPAADEQLGEVQTGDEFARLAFTFASDAQIDEGCRRLGAVLAEA